MTSILGRPAQYSKAPWFWSEQYGKLIQIAGLPSTDLQLLSAEGGEAPIWRFGRDGIVTAVAGVGRSREMRGALKLMPTLEPAEPSAGMGY